MKRKSDIPKENFSLRIPSEINKKIVERAEKIGISKSALILSLLYREFEEKSQEKNR